MENHGFDLETRRVATVQEDWLASLPEEKNRVFASVVEDLEVSYTILSVSLNDAFSLCDQGKLGTAREQAAMFSDLFRRLAGRLRGVLRTLEEHARHYGTLSRIEPLRATTFRSHRGRKAARANQLLTAVTTNKTARFFRKVAALDQLVAGLQSQVHAIVAELREGAALWPRRDWASLEVLHHDVNTCFRETTIVLKSFLCVMPAKELLPFGKRLRLLVPGAVAAIPSRRLTRFVTKMVTACAPQPARRPRPTSAERAGKPD